MLTLSSTEYFTSFTPFRCGLFPINVHGLSLSPLIEIVTNTFYLLFYITVHLLYLFQYLAPRVECVWLLLFHREAASSVWDVVWTSVSGSSATGVSSPPGTSVSVVALRSALGRGNNHFMARSSTPDIPPPTQSAQSVPEHGWADGLSGTPGLTSSFGRFCRHYFIGDRWGLSLSHSG